MDGAARSDRVNVQTSVGDAWIWTLPGWRGRPSLSSREDRVRVPGRGLPCLTASSGPRNEARMSGLAPRLGVGGGSCRALEAPTDSWLSPIRGRQRVGGVLSPAKRDHATRVALPRAARSRPAPMSSRSPEGERGAHKTPAMGVGQCCPQGGQHLRTGRSPGARPALALRISHGPSAGSAIRSANLAGAADLAGWVSALRDPQRQSPLVGVGVARPAVAVKRRGDGFGWPWAPVATLDSVVRAAQ
jgi:hypothetical protein